MKKIILLLFLGCCCILSGCHGNETFEENCIGFYKFFTTWKDKCDEYRFIFRDVKNDKKLCETIFSLCRSNGFDFIKETEGYYWDDFDKRGDKELLATRPQFKVFIFFHTHIIRTNSHFVNKFTNSTCRHLNLRHILRIVI